MKRNRIKIGWIFGTIAVGLVVAFYLSVAATVRDRTAAVLSVAFRRPVTVQAAQVIFPLGIHLTGIRVPSGPGQGGGPSFLVQEVAADLSLNSLLKGRPGMNVELIGPKLTLERDPQGFFTIPPEALFQSFSQGEGSGLLLNRLRIRDGRFTFIDRGVMPEVVWVVRNLSLSLSSGPKFGGYHYSLLGVLEDSLSSQEVGKLEINGESLLGISFESHLLMDHKAIERLGPYLRRILGVVPSQGSCLVKAKITAVQGSSVAEVDLTASQVAFSNEEPTLLGPPGNRLVELLRDPEGKIHLSFGVKGRPGDRLDWSDIAAGAFRESMRQALARGIQQTLTDAEVNKPLEEMIRKSYESQGR